MFAQDWLQLYTQPQKTQKLEQLSGYLIKIEFKGSDRLCKVVELSMQYCGQILQDSFETFEMVTRSINPEFERNVDVQTQYFWVDTFSELFFFKLLNIDDEK